MEQMQAIAEKYFEGQLLCSGGEREVTLKHSIASAGFGWSDVLFCLVPYSF